MITNKKSIAIGLLLTTVIIILWAIQSSSNLPANFPDSQSEHNAFLEFARKNHGYEVKIFKGNGEEISVINSKNHIKQAAYFELRKNQSKTWTRHTLTNTDNLVLLIGE